MRKHLNAAAKRQQQEGTMTAKTKNPRPPEDRDQGRHALPDGERMVVFATRLLPAQRDKVRKGGAKWLRDLVDAAKLPRAKKGGA
jgi:hypothetical protein